MLYFIYISLGWYSIFQGGRSPPLTPRLNLGVKLCDKMTEYRGTIQRENLVSTHKIQN